MERNSALRPTNRLHAYRAAQSRCCYGQWRDVGQHKIVWYVIACAPVKSHSARKTFESNSSAITGSAAHIFYDCGPGAEPRPRSASSAMACRNLYRVRYEKTTQLFPDQLGAQHGTAAFAATMAPTAYDVRMHIRRRSGRFARLIVTGDEWFVSGNIDSWHDHGNFTYSAVNTTVSTAPVPGSNHSPCRNDRQLLMCAYVINQAANYADATFTQPFRKQFYQYPGDILGRLSNRKGFSYSANDSFHILSLQFRINSNEGDMYGKNFRRSKVYHNFIDRQLHFP